jgi:tellurium resistance protein TerD
VSLAENGRSFSQLEVSLGWNAKNPACDLDASAFLLAGNNKVVGDEWFVFYGQEQSPDGSVVHRGESAGGVGETLAVDLGRMDARVKKIVFIITINEALKQGLNFGMVSDAYIQLLSPAAGKGILHFELEEYYSNVTSMMVGELYERNGEWKFHAIGNGVARDLAGLCELYGVNVSG